MSTHLLGQAPSFSDSSSNYLEGIIHLRHLFSKAEFCTHYDLDSAIIYTQQGIKQAQENRLKGWESIFLLKQGAIHFRSGDRDKYNTVTKRGAQNIPKQANLRSIFQLLLATGKTMESNYEEAKIILNTLPNEITSRFEQQQFEQFYFYNKEILSANILAIGGFPDLAISKYDSALIYGKSNFPEVVLLKALGNLGYMYMAKNDFHKAVPLILRCRDLNIKNESFIGLLSNYRQLGLIYLRLGSYKKALDNFNKAIQTNHDHFHNEKKDTYLQTYHCFTLYKVKEVDAEESIERMEKLLSLAQESNFREIEVIALNFLGKIHSENGEINIAFKYHLEVIQRSQESDNNDILTSSLKEISRLIFSPILQQEKTVLSIVLEALLAEEKRKANSGDLVSLLNLKNGIEQYYLSTGKVEAAFDKRIEIDSLELLTDAKEKRELLVDFEMKYALSEKDKTIFLRETQLKNQKKDFFFIILLLGLLGIIGIMKIYNDQKIKSIQEINELKNKISNDLHDDIGSTLGHINLLTQQLSRDNSSPEIRKRNQKLILEKSKYLTSAMSDIIWSLDANRNKLKDLIQRIYDYLEEILEESTITYKITENKALSLTKLNTDQKQHIFFIFKEAIQNIIKHTHSDSILVAVKESDTELHVEITNTFTKLKTAKSSSKLGIKNMERRAKAIGGKINISSSPDRFTVFLILNLNSNP